MKKMICVITAVLTACLVFTSCSVFRGGAPKYVDASAPEFIEKHGNVNNNYYYGRLSESEKQAYVNILNKIYSFPEKINIPLISIDDLKEVWVALSYDNPRLFMLSKEIKMEVKGRKAYFCCKYEMSREEYEKELLELDERIAQIASVANSLPESFNKELYIHDYIIDNCKYVIEDTLMNHNAYGTLVEGKASCEGYAKAAKLLLDAVGIKNYLVVGTATDFNGMTEGHMWNVVEIKNEKYNLDVTWDDPVNKNQLDIKSYAYFNVTDEEIKKTHKFDSIEPGCTATELNYFVKNNKYIKSYGAETKEQIAKVIALDSESMKTELKFKDEATFQKAFDELIKGEDIYRILDVAKISSNTDFSTSQIQYIKNDVHYILELKLVKD